MNSKLPLIQISTLSKYYAEGNDTRIIFENLNLDIYRGECIALLGPSGSGKSTFLNLASGIDLPNSGQIKIDSRALTGLSEAERTRFRRRHIGFVFQFFNLIPTLTVEENVFLPLELNRLNDARQRQQALDLLNQVGLGDRLNSFPEQLSGGEQQRLAIVRAIVHQPLLLLADEPTGNLDAENSARVLDILFQLPQQTDVALLMVTHSREIAAQADHVFCLEAGRLQEIQP